MQMAYLLGLFAVFCMSLTNGEIGKECKDNGDCGGGSSCVAGDSQNPVQRCVANPPCTGNAVGRCPVDPLHGPLACIWRPDDGKNCNNKSECKEMNGKLGIYKCMSLARCDQYHGGECSKSCAANGRPCNGRGSCQTEGNTPWTFTCSCDSGWNGNRCNNVINGSCQVDVGQCGEHGKCLDSNCKCFNGYKGEQCELAPPFKNSSTSNSISTSLGGSVDGDHERTNPSTDRNNNNNPGKNSQANDASSTTNTNKNGATVYVIIGIIATLIVIASVGFAYFAKKKKKANDGFERQESATNLDFRPQTPKDDIVVM